MRVVLYARCSTSLGQNPEIQINELTEVANRKGYEIVGKYIDIISGGKSANQRPQLSNLMKDAVARRFDCVMVWSLDRLARSVEHFVNTTNELNSLNIQIYFHKESIDGSTPTGKALLQMCSVVAELERSLISERVSLGVRHSIKTKGTWGGRPTNLTPQVKDRVVELRERGLGVRKIATQLKIGVGTTYNILKLERKVA